MAFDGALLNRPSDSGGERAVSDGLFVLVHGRGRGAARRGGALAERRRRRRRAAARVQARPPLDREGQPGRAGPDDAGRSTRARRRAGVQRFSWDGRNADGSPAAEGQWRLSVSATDEGGQATVGRPLLLARPHARRALGLARAHAHRAGRPADRVVHAHAARRASPARCGRGAAPSSPRSREPSRRRPGRTRCAGTARSAQRWIASGQYLVRIRAVSTVGASELEAPVTIRRVAPARAPKRG